MKALVYTGTQSLEFKELPIPECAPGESLVEVKASGICGSDMHAWHGHDPRRIPPLVLGHELSGVVQSGPMAGQRVAINPLTGCDHCRYCKAAMPNLCGKRDLLGLGRAGGYAEYICVPDVNLFALPDTLSDVHASLMEPTAVSLHAIHLAERALLRPVSESRALILGGGAIGVLAALLLQQKGVRELWIAETSAPRRKTLEIMCKANIYDPKGTNIPPADSFELIVDAVGSGASRASASQLACAGGVISHIGLQDNEAGLDTRRLTLQEITFIGNYTYNPSDLQASLDLLDDGSLGSLEWVETRPLSEGATAFQDIHDATTSAPKIVLLP